MVQKGCEIETLDFGRNTNIYNFISKYPRFSKYPIKEFRVDKDNERFCSVDGVVYSKDMKTLVLYPSYKEDAVFVMPNEVESIYGGISSNHLKEITISKNLVDIKVMTFFDCENLDKINIPEDHCELWEDDSFKKGFVLDI